MRDLAARCGAAELTTLPGDRGRLRHLQQYGADRRARGIEIECARGFRKRYWMQSNLGRLIR